MLCPKTTLLFLLMYSMSILLYTLHGKQIFTILAFAIAVQMSNCNFESHTIKDSKKNIKSKKTGWKILSVVEPLPNRNNYGNPKARMNT